MTNKNASYLVCVALNDPKTNKPDMKTLQCFKGTSKQAFNYHANIWHHPMIALESQIDFVCFVFERRENQKSITEDTEEVFFPKTPILAQLAKL